MTEAIFDKPKTVIAIGIVLTIWQVMGVLAFCMQWNLSPRITATMSPSEVELYRSMPLWVWAAYATAVVTGTAGAVCLVFRKAWAVKLYLACLIGILINSSYALVISNAWIEGIGSVWFPLFVIVESVLENYFARRWAARGLFKSNLRRF